MNKQEEMWAGKFGDEYTERCSSLSFFRRLKFWNNLICMYGDMRVLEVGCNVGDNLNAIDHEIWDEFDADSETYGIDINRAVLDTGGARGRVYGKATDIPFKDNFFDLVFTCGLLIHIPPDDLLKVMGEMVRCSRKYVMFMEYWAEKEEEIEYRGEMGLLWKRPYKDIFLSSFSVPEINKKIKEKYIEDTKEKMKKYPEIEWRLEIPDFECIDEGFLTKDDGFDDVTWWLFERK